MSKLQSEEKYELRYKANRELIWAMGFLIMGNQVGISGGEDWIVLLLGGFGIISLVMAVYFDWRLRK